MPDVAGTLVSTTFNYAMGQADIDIRSKVGSSRILVSSNNLIKCYGNRGFSPSPNVRHLLEQTCSLTMSSREDPIHHSPSKPWRNFSFQPFQMHCAWGVSTVAIIRCGIQFRRLSCRPSPQALLLCRGLHSHPLGRSSNRPSEFHGPSLLGSQYMIHSVIVPSSKLSVFKSVPILLDRVPFLAPEALTNGLLAVCGIC